jgi:hypothetical protein
MFLGQQLTQQTVTKNLTHQQLLQLQQRQNLINQQKLQQQQVQQQQQQLRMQKVNLTVSKNILNCILKMRFIHILSNTD